MSVSDKLKAIWESLKTLNTSVADIEKEVTSKGIAREGTFGTVLKESDDWKIEERHDKNNVPAYYIINTSTDAEYGSWPDEGSARDALENEYRKTGKKRSMKRRSEADGNRQEMVDRGDYGSTPDAFKKDISISKGKSEPSKELGNRQEMVDKGDYILSSKEGKILIKEIPTLQEAVAFKKQYGGLIKKQSKGRNTKTINKVLASRKVINEFVTRIDEDYKIIDKKKLVEYITDKWNIAKENVSPNDDVYTKLDILDEYWGNTDIDNLLKSNIIAELTDEDYASRDATEQTRLFGRLIKKQNLLNVKKDRKLVKEEWREYDEHNNLVYYKVISGFKALAGKNKKVGFKAFAGKQRKKGFRSLVNKTARDWKLVIDIKNEWKALEDAREAFPAFIKKLRSYVSLIEKRFDEDVAYEYENIIEDLEMVGVEELEEFYGAWNVMYDWADDNSIFLKTF